MVNGFPYVGKDETRYTHERASGRVAMQLTPLTEQRKKCNY